jgi:glycerol uptake facilitator-like aquaporin
MRTFVSEAIGTFVLIAVILMKPGPVYIAIGFLAAILIAYRSGSNLNPIVTIVNSLNGTITNSQVAEYLVGQLIGGIVALQLVNKYNK